MGDRLRELGTLSPCTSCVNGIARQIIADLRERGPDCYFRSWRAITMRLIWLVPS